MKRFLMALACLGWMTGCVESAFAWQEPASAFPHKLGAAIGSTFSVATETDLIVMETSSLGFSVPSPGGAPPVYGISGGFDLILAQTTGSVDGLKVNVSPLIGVGVDVFLDAAPLVNGGQAPIALFGFNAIGPDLAHFISIAGVQDVIPTADFLWNLNDHTFVSTVGLRAPLGWFENDGVHKVAGPF